MSIFQKDCPECAAPNPVSAKICYCGYSFEPEAAGDGDPTEYAQQQDQLYRDYLAARIAQAEAELIVARELAASDPENTYKASGALLAEQALNKLQAEMKQLSLRIPTKPIARARSAAPRPTPPPAKPPVKSLFAKPVVAVKPASAPAARIQTAPQVRPAPRSEPIKHLPPKQALPKPKMATGIRRKAAPLPAATPARGKVVSAVTALARTVKALVPTAQAQPTAKPDASFRRAQAQKAEAIARAKAAAAKQQAMKRPMAAKTAAPKPSPERAPADIPPLTLGPVAAPKSTATQDCPNCTATLAIDAQRCGCGYTFARVSEQVPALSLDATALAILTEGISSLNPNRRR